MENERAAFVASVHVKYPATRFMVGIGVGDSPEQAEENAQIDAAATIRSNIESNATHIELAAHGTSGSTSAQTWLSKTVRHVNTESGALILPQRAMTRWIGEKWHAVAIAERAKLDERYAVESAAKRAELEALYAAVLSADQPPEHVPWCIIERLERALDQKDVERRLVSGQSVWSNELLEQRREVVHWRQTSKASFLLAVKFDAAEVSEQVGEVLRRRVSQSGLSVQIQDGAPCASGDSLVLDVSVKERCGDAPIGAVRCEVALAGQARRCQESGVVFTLSSDWASGFHATQTAVARQKALHNVDAEGFSRALVESVQEIAGVECTQ